MFVVAVISHHLRDGNRRGLWFWPFGSTPPLPYWLYISCTVALPFFLKEMKSSIDKIVVIPTSRQNSVLVDMWRNVNKIMIKQRHANFPQSLSIQSVQSLFPPMKNERTETSGKRKNGRAADEFSRRAQYARRNLKTEVLLLKRIKCFPFSLLRGNLKTLQSLVIWICA